MPARQILLPGPGLPTNVAGPAFTMTEATATSMIGVMERTTTVPAGGLEQLGNIMRGIISI